MKLWWVWFTAVQSLKSACSRNRTFLWLCLVLMGFTVRTDNAGVSSFIRALSLSPRCYASLLHLFHSNALSLDKLTQSWYRLVLQKFTPVQYGARHIILADGIKVPKEGRKMPAVKKLHQESGNNSKPSYILGHSFQALGLLVSSATGKLSCVPLCSRIHEGVISTNRDKRTLLDKLAAMFADCTQEAGISAILVADTYYASQKIILPLLKKGHHLISRAKSNCVAYLPPQQKTGCHKLGRPRLYGRKIHVHNVWCLEEHFKSAPSPVYGEKGVKIRYVSYDLIWRPVGRKIRFVWVIHPYRGRIILICTDRTIAPLDIITLYSYRYKIELSFKQAMHTIGSYGYHFWMKDMTSDSKQSGNQYLHRKPKAYRDGVQRKLNAYHKFVQLGCIAQGLLQYLALHFHRTVWKHFRSWLRTMDNTLPPSEAVVAQAMRSSLPEFLLVSVEKLNTVKFLSDCMEVERYEGFWQTG